jgi:hypothetical protein
VSTEVVEECPKAGHRYLLRRLWSKSVDEYRVVEVSPSGKRFKAGNVWHDFADYVIVEELPAPPSQERT